jgi:selenoprotein W-related protein
MLRAAWMGQEMLTTFQDEIGELALIPATGGVFEIAADGKGVWSRAAEGGFPEIAELKRRIRDAIAPGKNLGHSERRSGDERGSD